VSDEPSLGEMLAQFQAGQAAFGQLLDQQGQHLTKIDRLLHDVRDQLTRSGDQLGDVARRVNDLPPPQVTLAAG
jgi:hypothetical protein